MSLCVLDCSVAAAWCFEDEATPETEALLDQVCEQPVMVPPLWHIEISNTLAAALRRGRIRKATLIGRLAMLRMFPIVTDAAVPDLLREAIVELAVSEQLTAYDACYLDLAIRSDLPLATLDAALLKAAQRRGVVALP